jgi:hypothetical protein
MISCPYPDPVIRAICSITPRQVLQKIPAGSDSVYIRVDENKLYWVKGDENGAVDIW